MMAIRLVHLYDRRGRRTHFTDGEIEFAETDDLTRGEIRGGAAT